MSLLRSRHAIPYLLMAPGLLWLFLFFVVPNIQMLLFSLSEGTLRTGFRTPPEVWDIQNFTGSLGKFSANFSNSIVYGGLATILCFLIGYPLAYAIAFKGGRWKNLLLFLVIAPFFTSFLIRTISWRIILGNDGPVLSVVRDALGLVPDNFSIIGTPLAVVGGLTYQFLPFMVLPLYVSIEKVDRRLIEAAEDLYAGPWRRGGLIAGAVFGAFLVVALQVGLGYARIVGDEAAPAAVVGSALVGAAAGGLIGSLLISQAFIRVTFPLSLPGVFAASILTFIPAIGDYVNAQLLGSPKTQMVGNVIQGRFLDQNDYPIAAALAFLLMAGILLAIFLYARILGTEELTGGTA
ncbi:MAG TPA: ABC transporter permease [Candidatus Sulfomarinibacteraceae bacterium]|nr:ABC transporter permease [Candidatus Sulfomarinibacteraceae bacterium]